MLCGPSGPGFCLLHFRLPFRTHKVREDEREAWEKPACEDDNDFRPQHYTNSKHTTSTARHHGDAKRKRIPTERTSSTRSNGAHTLPIKRTAKAGTSAVLPTRPPDLDAGAKDETPHVHTTQDTEIRSKTSRQPASTRQAPVGEFVSRMVDDAPAQTFHKSTNDDEEYKYFHTKFLAGSVVGVSALVDWIHQGQENQEVRMYIQLLRGTQILSQRDMFGIASRTRQRKTVLLEGAIALLAQPGDRYEFFYHIGGVGGHSVTVYKMKVIVQYRHGHVDDVKNEPSTEYTRSMVEFLLRKDSASSSVQSKDKGALRRAPGLPSSSFRTSEDQTTEDALLWQSILSLVELTLEENDRDEFLRRFSEARWENLAQEFVRELAAQYANGRVVEEMHKQGVKAYLRMFRDLWCSSAGSVISASAILRDSPKISSPVFLVEGNVVESLKERLRTDVSMRSKNLYEKLAFCVLRHPRVAFVNVSSPAEVLVKRSLLDRNLPFPQIYSKVMEGELDPASQDWGSTHFAQRVSEGWYTLRPDREDKLAQVEYSSENPTPVGCWNQNSTIQISPGAGTHESNMAGAVLRRLAGGDVLLVDTSDTRCEESNGVLYLWWNSVCLKICSSINCHRLAWAHPVARTLPANTVAAKGIVHAVLVAMMPVPNPSSSFPVNYQRYIALICPGLRHQL